MSKLTLEAHSDALEYLDYLYRRLNYAKENFNDMHPEFVYVNKEINKVKALIERADGFSILDSAFLLNNSEDFWS